MHAPNIWTAPISAQTAAQRLITVECVIATGTFTAAVIMLIRTPVPPVAILVSATLYFFSLYLPYAGVRRAGGSTRHYLPSEAGLVLALVLAGGPAAVVAAAAGALAIYAVNTRNGMARIKRTYNLASETALAGVSVAVWVALTQAFPATPVGAATALLGAALVSNLLSQASLSVVIALVEGRVIDLHVLREVNKSSSLITIAAAGFAVFAGDTAVSHHSYLPLLILPPVSFAAHKAHSGYRHLRMDRDLWRSMEVASQGIHDAGLAYDEVARRGADHACYLFGAVRTELLLDDPETGTSVRYEARPGGTVNTDVLRGTDTERVSGHGTIIHPLQAGPDATILGRLVIHTPPNTLGSAPPGMFGATFARAIGQCLQNARLHQTLVSWSDEAWAAARRDELTGLGNRVAFHEFCEKNTAEGMTVLVINLDRFKQINDTLGHPNGDEVLQGVARRLSDASNERRLVVRLSGDEFLVVAPGTPDKAQADVLGGTILVALQEPFAVSGMRLPVSASIGIALAASGEADSDLLMRQADAAMCEAKRLGGARHVQFCPAYGQSLDRDALELFGAVRAAISNGEIVLYYQPQIGIDTSEVVGLEALVRWQHPRHGLITPARFLQAIERSQLIHEFTRHVLWEANKALAALTSEGHTDITMSVNLSSRNLLDMSVVEHVQEAIQRWGTDPARLVLEITETSALSDSPSADHVLKKLSALGIQISLDDFGTGYNSYAILARAGANEIKVDQSFVRDLLTSEDSRRIVRSTVDLGHSFGIRVVAEGVESQELLDTLTAMHCDVVQGYHISRPVSLIDVAGWLHARPGPDPVDTTRNVVDLADRERVFLSRAPAADGAPRPGVPKQVGRDDNPPRRRSRTGT